MPVSKTLDKTFPGLIKNVGKLSGLKFDLLDLVFIISETFFIG